MEFSVCHSKCHVRMYKIFNLKSGLVLTNLQSSMFANFVRPQCNSSKFINSASALRSVLGSSFFFFFFVKNYSIKFNNAFKNSFDVNGPMLQNFYCLTIDQTTGLLSMPDSIMPLFFFHIFSISLV